MHNTRFYNEGALLLSLHLTSQVLKNPPQWFQPVLKHIYSQYKSEFELLAKAVFTFQPEDTDLEESTSSSSSSTSYSSSGDKRTASPAVKAKRCLRRFGLTSAPSFGFVIAFKQLYSRLSERLESL